MRPGVRVKFPWKLVVGANTWIGADVWIHNQDRLTIGHDVVISQGSAITTGTHAFRTDVALRTRPVLIEPPRDAAAVSISHCPRRIVRVGGEHLDIEVSLRATRHPCGVRRVAACSAV